MQGHINEDIWAGHLPEGRVLGDVVEKSDRPKEGHLRARANEIPESTTDPEVDRNWVKRNLLPLFRCDRRNQ